MAVNLSPLAGAGWQFFDNNGVILSGGLLYTYAAGTTTPQATYTSSTGGTANANPIVLDSTGRTTNEVWLTQGVVYKFTLKTSIGTTLWTYDNVSGINDFGALSASTGSSLIGFLPVSGSATTVQAAIRALQASDLTFALKGANTDITSLASPALASATATTQTAGDNTTKVATTAFVTTAVGNSQIQPISASVASNALTISASALSLAFRSTTLGSGTITTVAGTPSNLVVPATSTLGTVNAVQSRLAVLALNNAGTIELAVSNIAGGTNLTETGLATTTSITQTSSFTGSIAVTTGILTLSSTPTGTFAIGQALSGTNVNSGTYIVSLLTGSLGVSGSTYQTNQLTAAASTTMTGVAGMGIYSTTARTSVAYRVIGYIESTQTTAGTWATAPSTIQGEGGQALTAMSSVGYGQTWQTFAVGSARVVGTTYYNTTGKPILLNTYLSSTGTMIYTVNGVTINGTGCAAGTVNGGSSVFIPVGASYSCSAATNWYELR
jgi:hypothetical protein